MAISKGEKARLTELATVERLLSEGMETIERGEDANEIADELLRIAQRTGDPLVAEVAAIAHGGISSGQLIAAGRALATVNDQIGTATNAFSLAARIAEQGEADLTIPFIAGRASAMLEMLKALKSAAEAINGAGDADALIDALASAADAVGALRDEAANFA
jgi:hypothetical protein